MQQLRLLINAIVASSWNYFTISVILCFVCRLYKYRQSKIISIMPIKLPQMLGFGTCEYYITNFRVILANITSRKPFVFLNCGESLLNYLAVTVDYGKKNLHLISNIGRNQKFNMT